MAEQTLQSIARAAWRLAAAQHWAITRAQLLALGFNGRAIDRRIAGGRLHPVHRGVYAVGRPQLTRLGHFRAAVLASGDGAVLSHASAAEVWKLRPREAGDIEVSLVGRSVERPGLRTHRRRSFRATQHDRVPVTTPIQTLLDIAPRLTPAELETAINQADYHRLATPEQIWNAVGDMRGAPGAGAVRKLLAPYTHVVTHTELERMLVPIARAAGMPPLLSQVWLNGSRVDFYCPELGVAIETDGGLAHRSALRQTQDTRRDHRHFAADVIPIRFTHAQVAFEPAYVRGVLEEIARRRRGASATPPGPAASSATGSRSGGSARASR